MVEELSNQASDNSRASKDQKSERKSHAIDQGRSGFFGIKAGMTQVYDAKGNVLAVTVIDLPKNIVTQIKTDSKEGYTALQVGLIEKKISKVTRPEAGKAKKTGLGPFYHTVEIRFPTPQAVASVSVGDEVTAGFLKEGDLVDIQAVSKGKGVQGVMKRHNYSGGHDSHGASISHRQIGSIGNRADPAKVFKGKKMAGHMGNRKVTIQNVKVVKVDLKNGFMLLNGSVPGSKASVVSIRKAVKALGVVDTKTAQLGR